MWTGRTPSAEHTLRLCFQSRLSMLGKIACGTSCPRSTKLSESCCWTTLLQEPRLLSSRLPRHLKSGFPFTSASIHLQIISRCGLWQHIDLALAKAIPEAEYKAWYQGPTMVIDSSDIDGFLSEEIPVEANISDYNPEDDGKTFTPIKEIPSHMLDSQHFLVS